MRTGFVLAVSVALTACKGNGPAAPTNNPPVIDAITVMPARGIPQVTRYSFSATATDPENEALTYQWTINGQPQSGASVSGLIFQRGGDLTATVTVTDPHGAATSKDHQFVVGTLTGTWTMDSPILGPCTLTLTQNFTALSGTIATPYGTGQSYSAFNSIQENGEFSIAFLIPNVTAFRFFGQLDPSGKRVVGSVDSNDFPLHDVEWTKTS